MNRIFNPLIAQHRKVAAAVAIAAASSNALALGGLDKAKTAADDIKTGLYALVGVVALIYLIYLGVMAFTEKKSWADFGWGRGVRLFGRRRCSARRLGLDTVRLMP